MKVQLLYLDPHDDQVSVRDKMGWVKAPRLLVIWPRRGRVLSSRLDLTLINRHAARRGARLGLVTFDPDVRDNAQDLGIPVFDSIDSTPEAVWRAAEAKAPKFEAARPDRERLADRQPRPGATGATEPRRLSIGRRAGFALGVAAVVALIAALGPSATVVITPKTTVQHAQIEVRLDPEADTLTSDNHVPAVRRSLQVAGELRIPASGEIAVPAAPATGVVVFTNLGDNTIVLPRGTGVRADAPGQARFETLVSVTLDAGAGSQASVAVQAAQNGATGNVPAEAIGSIEGPIGLQVSVTNPEPTKGGTETAKPAVTSTDLHQLETRLQTQLLAQADAQFSSQLGVGEAWVPASLQIDRTLQKSFDAQVDDVAQSVALQMKLEVSGLVYHPQTVEAAGLRALSGDSPPGTEPVPGTAKASGVPVKGAPERLTVTASQTIYDVLPKMALVNALVGQPSASVGAIVSTLSPGSQATLELRPPWLPRLPWLPMRIDVRTPWEGP